MDNNTRTAPAKEPYKPLTRAQVENAKRDRSHVAITELDRIGQPHWNSLVDSLRGAEDNRGGQMLIEKAFIPLAEALEGKQFSLGPLEFVSIWVRMDELLPLNTDVKTRDGLDVGHLTNFTCRYGLAQSILCPYATLTIESQDWKHLYKNFVESQKGTMYLQDVAIKNRDGALVFRQRFAEIRKNVGMISNYEHEVEFDATVNRVGESLGNTMVFDSIVELTL